MQIRRLEPKGDRRGWLYQLPSECYDFLGDIREIHTGSIKSGELRGNHVHHERKEILQVICFDRGEFIWRAPRETENHVETLTGECAVLFEIEPGIAHTIRNPGKQDLLITAFCNLPYSPEITDTEKTVFMES